MFRTIQNNTSFDYSASDIINRRHWYPRRDLNPHVFRHYTLNVARLPIPSHGHIWLQVAGVMTSRLSGEFRTCWCPKWDLNPHTLRYLILSQARLPVPPFGHNTHFLIPKTAASQGSYGTNSRAEKYSPSFNRVCTLRVNA